ncbi:MAG: hypothetical protein JWM99_1598 [Verrucomicrobiales bacterium]|nr:hypothetical protein [Verrucomicrobiales bacterium]
MSEPILESSVERGRKAVALVPTFFGGLGGIWLFTWKAQLTSRRLSLALVSLFTLPVLIYLTTSSPKDWAQNRPANVGDPKMFLNAVSKRLVRAGVPLQPAQKVELETILTDEYTRTEDTLAEIPASQMSAERQRQEIGQCRERIRKQAQNVLDERQFAVFQNYRPPNRFEQPPPLADLQWNRTAPFYHWLIDLYFFILVPLNCVRMCGALIRDELDADTLGFLITRPLSRARLLCIKYISQITWLQLWLLTQTLLLFAAGRLKEIPDLRNLLPLFLGAQFLAILAWGALGLFLGLVSKKYMALALVYGSIVEMGIGRIPTNINTLSLMRHLKTLLGHNPALESIYNWSAIGFLGPVGALFLGTLLFLTLAALMFSYREYHHTTEMQK